MGTTKPAHEIKLGKIKATIWANETEDHAVWFNVLLLRLYKNGNGWKETTALRRDDLPIAMKAMDMAYSWIWTKEEQVQRAERSAANQVLAGARRSS